MNKIDQLFQTKEDPLLSLYLTAGFPHLNSLQSILPVLEQAGVDFVEIGMPFSDPLADGPTIQNSSQAALENGMNLKLLFQQLSEIQVKLPLILMGYLNPVLQFGLERFLQECKKTGISGLILPDLPVNEYLKNKHLFESNGIHPILLVTPQTSPERVQYLATVSKGFLYLVSSSSTTGTTSFSESDPEYFLKINEMQLPLPAMIGFGIQNHSDFMKAGKLARGAIIGSAFMKLLDEKKNHSTVEIKNDILTFVGSIKSH